MKPMILAAGLLASGAVQASEWEIDSAHTTVQFSVRHMMVSTVRGTFGKVTGKVDLDDHDVSRSSIDVVIDVSSIDTHEAKRDGHLKSPDFFDVAKYPTMTFKSTKIAKGDGGRWLATGDLTIHGNTHPVTLTVEPLGAPQKSPWGTEVRGASASTKLSRKLWGLTWNMALETGGVLVGDEVSIQIDAELVQKAPQHAEK